MRSGIASLVWNVFSPEERISELYTRIASLVVAYIWLFSPSLLSAGQQAVSLTLEQAVGEALVSNPDLASMKARAQALAEVPDQQGALPDPQLSLRAANLPVDSFTLDQEPMTQLQVALTQTLPYPGKLSLREEIADLESSAAGFSVDETRILLIRDVKIIWWNIYYLDRALETLEVNHELLRQLNTTAQTKYKVGQGLQQEVLMAQLELSRLLDNKISLSNMRRKEAIRLNTLLGRQTDSTFVLPVEPTENIPEVPSEDQLIDQARMNSPLIKEMKMKADAAKMKLKLAKLKFFPDFMAGASYGYREGENPDGSDRPDFATFALSVNLPFVNRQEKESIVTQSKYEALQHEHLVNSTENKVLERLASAVDDYKRSIEEVELLKKGIIPQARQTLDSMLAGYQVNKVDFLNLIRAQTSLYEYETRYWKSFSSAQQALARVAAAMGKENINE